MACLLFFVCFFSCDCRFPVSFLCSLRALLNAVFLVTITNSASDWMEPPATRFVTIRLCSTRFAGTLNSCSFGRGLSCWVASVRVEVLCSVGCVGAGVGAFVRLGIVLLSAVVWFAERSHWAVAVSELTVCAGGNVISFGVLELVPVVEARVSSAVLVSGDRVETAWDEFLYVLLLC